MSGLALLLAGGGPSIPAMTRLRRRRMSRRMLDLIACHRAGINPDEWIAQLERQRAAVHLELAQVLTQQARERVAA